MPYKPREAGASLRPAHDAALPKPAKKPDFAGLSGKERIVHIEKRRDLTVETALRVRLDQCHKNAAAEPSWCRL